MGERHCRKYVTSFKATLSKVRGWCSTRARDLRERLLKSSKRTKLGLIIGGASAVVVIGLVLFLVLFLRPVFVVAAVDTEDAVVSGEDILLSVDVTNEGRTTGEYEPTVLVDGTAFQAERVTLASGAREQVAVRVPGLPPGRHHVSLAGWPESAQDVWVMTPAAFEIDRVRVQPRPMDLATTDQAEVQVGVTNVGEARGSYELKVALDGQVVAVREIELEGGLHASETFAVTIAKPGSYEVAVGDEHRVLEVYKVERPGNGTKLVDRLSDGPSCLTVTNHHDDTDCVVVVTGAGEDRSPLLAVYVRAGSTYTAERIGDGTYTCYYLLGEDWCSYRRDFIRAQDRGRFVEPMEVESPGWAYTWITTEFGVAPEESSPTGEEEEEPSLAEDTSPTEDVSREDFPDISAVVNTPLGTPPQSTTVPPARLFHQMVYDAPRDQMVLFGGMVEPRIFGDEQLDDTWSYDPDSNAWILLQLLGDVCLGRGHSSLVFDPGSDKMVLFGGISSHAKPLNDTWAYDRATNTWTDLRPAGRVPSKRSDHSMVYDPDTGKVILFGGYDGSYLDDTWAYDPKANTWTELKPSGGVPLGRCRHSLIYDPVSHKAILFGGVTKQRLSLGGPQHLNETWAYDPGTNTWTELKPSGDLPPGRIGPCLFYDPAGARVILFGGERPWVEASGVTTTRSLNDLWAFDPAAKTWTELKPSGDLPPGRAHASLVYDPALGKAILFGGANGSTIHNERTVLEGSTSLNDTWAYDPVANTWTELLRSEPVLVLDASGQEAEGGRSPSKYELKGIISVMLRQQVLVR